jgi:poly [ADP-ribose] polymerase
LCHRNSGQCATENFGDVAAAKSAFEKKFHDKTKNQFAARAKFVAVKGKYTLIETDFGAEEDEKPAAKASATQDKKKVDVKVRGLVSLCLCLPVSPVPRAVCRSRRARWTRACRTS